MSPMSAATGWVIAILVMCTIALPSLARRRLRADRPNSRVQWLQTHYWIGYTIAGLSVVHVTFALAVPMSATPAYQLGLWIATGGMLIAFGQVALGRQLRQRTGPARARLRRIHIGVLVALVIAGGVHIWLDGALLHQLIGVS